MADSTWQQRVDALGRGHYRRYDERTATMLGEVAEAVLDDYRDEPSRPLRTRSVTFEGMSTHSAQQLPGDDLLPDAGLVMDRMLHLDGAAEDAWPWVEQLGKERAGWYMPRAVERFVPRSRRATRAIQPRLLGLSVGDRIPDWGRDEPYFEVLQIEPPRHLVYWSERCRKPRRGVARPPMRLTWTLVLTELGPAATQLHLRLRLDLGKAPGPLPRYGGDLLDRVTVSLLGRGLNERLRQPAESA